jgi:two-component system, OmpR family, sensor kinase
MHFDDRLETVLRQSIRGDSLARTQYRQLLDILGSLPEDAEGPQIDAAYNRLRELSAIIPAGERTQALSRPYARLRSPRLLAVLAEHEPAVASAAIGAARLTERQWLALIPSLPVRARGFLRNRRGMGARIERLLADLGISDRGLPPARWEAGDGDVLELVDAVPEDAPGLRAGLVAETAETSDIGALLKRIEKFSQARRDAAAGVRHEESPRLPLGDPSDEPPVVRTAPFDFAADTGGRILRADPEVAPMVVGMRLASSDSQALAAAIRQRQPLRGLRMSIVGAPAVSGEWQVDAAPHFDPQIGGFTGYAGRFRRPRNQAAGGTALAAEESPGDRLRAILHELRNPAQAIQFSAEMIQQSALGQTPHEYRAIAAMIASDIAYVLAGFDELERLAKLESGTLELETGASDLADVVQRVAAQLEAYTAKRESGFELGDVQPPVPAGLDEAEAERLVWRLLAVLAGEAAPNERLALACASTGGEALLTAQLPAALAQAEGDALFASAGRPVSAARTLSAGMFGSGFSLRLAREEAKAAGGSLQRDGNQLRLILPQPGEQAASRGTA